MVKPSDLDARFGMGVAALFAVAASAFVVSASVPDSASLTVADKLHTIALGGIFLTLLISALCLRLEVRDREDLAFKIDHWSLAILPLYTVRAEVELGLLQATPLAGRPLRRTLRLLWREGRPLGPVARTFVQFLSDQFAPAP